MPDISLDAEFHVPEFLSNGPERVHMPDISLDAEFHTDTSGGINLINRNNRRINVDTDWPD